MSIIKPFYEIQYNFNAPVKIIYVLVDSFPSTTLKRCALVELFVVVAYMRSQALLCFNTKDDTRPHTL